MARICAGAFAPLLLTCFTLAGCAGTSRVDANLTTSTLAERKTAVALVRLGAAGTLCSRVSVLIGQREGEGFRGRQAVTVANVRTLTEAPVAEVELPPGEYHLLAYRCFGKQRTLSVGDTSDITNVYRSSFAMFRLEPGEIVNIGYLHFNANRMNLSMFGRPIRKEVYVTDWPLAELERFKRTRPQLFAQMKTRHMTVFDDSEGPTADTCKALKTMKAEGKVQTLPMECLAPPPVPPATIRPPRTPASREKEA